MPLLRRHDLGCRRRAQHHTRRRSTRPPPQRDASWRSLQPRRRFRRWHTLYDMSGSTDRSVARDRTTRNSPRRLRRAAATGPGTFCCATFCCDVAAFSLHRPLHHSCARQHLFAEQHRVEQWRV